MASLSMPEMILLGVWPLAAGPPNAGLGLPKDGLGPLKAELGPLLLDAREFSPLCD